MALGGRVPPKRVKANSRTEQMPRVLTRSHKTKQFVLALSDEDRSQERAHSTANDEDRREEQLDSAPNLRDISECRDEVHPQSPVRDWCYREGIDQHSSDINVEPSSLLDAQQAERSSLPDAQQAADVVCGSEEHTQQADEAPTNGTDRRTKGAMLDRMTRAMGRRLPITVLEGDLRPQKPVQAAKFASEGGVAIKQSVPILTHWKEYKKNDTTLEKFMGTLSGRLAMDTNDKAIKDACLNVLQSGVRQNRYRLKRKYFDGVAANEVRRTSLVSHMTDAEWRDLVTKWSNPKNQEISEKNKQNRAKVKYHQTTGSRSYIAHCYSIRQKYKDQAPNAVDYFKECHNSTKKGFSEPVQEAVAAMESMMAEPVEDGETHKSSEEVVSKVLKQTSANSKFLQNVGLQSTSMKTSSERDLVQQLERERQGAAVLQERVEGQQQEIQSQQQEIDTLKMQAQAAQEQMQEFKRKQEENDIILRRLLSFSQVNPSP